MLVLAAFGDETLPLRGESPALSALSGISTLVTAGFALWSAIRIHRRIADADHAADREPLAAIRNAAFSGQSRKD
ncbi:MAG: hypothetical protein HZA52_14175 [Planctomycetes bacterium]|nr:hypothetical protein [Planctomycetota bacterium]